MKWIAAPFDDTCDIARPGWYHRLPCTFNFKGKAASHTTRYEGNSAAQMHVLYRCHGFAFGQEPV